MKNEQASPILGMLGLARRAGALIGGTELVCQEMGKKKKPLLVLVSDTSSPATQKKLITKSAYYQIPVHLISIPGEELGRAVGRSVPLAAVAVTNPGIASQLEKLTGKDSSVCSGSENVYDGSKESD